MSSIQTKPSYTLHRKFTSTLVDGADVAAVEANLKPGLAFHAEGYESISCYVKLDTGNIQLRLIEIASEVTGQSYPDGSYKETTNHFYLWKEGTGQINDGASHEFKTPGGGRYIIAIEANSANTGEIWIAGGQIASARVK